MPTLLTDTSFDTPATEHSEPQLRRHRAVSLGWLLGKRVLGAVVVLWGAATAAFLAQIAIPGDRATVIFNARAGQAIQRTDEELASINETFGLQDPVLIQYLNYLGGLIKGDLGTSYQQFRPVSDILLEQIGPTLVLTISAIIISWLIMIAWVLLTAGRSPRLRGIGAGVDTAVAGLPHYWLGAILLLIFGLYLGWLPVVSGDSAAGLLLPALTLAIPLAGFMGQSTRSAYEQALQQPFVVSARTRGMGETAVRLRHVIRHALIPAVTLSGWALGATISGAVVVESVFNRPGIGSTLVNAVNTQDLPVVTGTVIVIAFLYVIANILVDAAYVLIDPRLKTS